MIPPLHNLFTVSESREAEVFEELLEDRGSFVLERIASYGHPTPPDSWYEQATTEWVLLMRGTAELRFVEGSLSLAAGDYLTIPAACRHRVEQVSDDAVWLALHIKN